MRRAIYRFVLALIAFSAFAAWADPVKEVAELGPARAKAFNAGDVEGWTAAYAENASWYSQFSPYRIDGKPAIRAYLTELFSRYPGPRNFMINQPVFRAYGDNLVVGDGYYQLTLTDRAGKAFVTHARYSITWVKLDGRWQIVDQHNAPIPGSQ